MARLIAFALLLSGVLAQNKPEVEFKWRLGKGTRSGSSRAAWLIEHQTDAGTWGYPEGAVNYDHSNTQYALLGLKDAARMGAKIPETVLKKAAIHWLDTQRVIGKKAALRIEGYEGQEPALRPSATDETFAPGPWGYLVKKPEAVTELIDQGYGSMTCAGLTSLLIAESELAAAKALGDALGKQIDEAKKKGLI